MKMAKDEDRLSAYFVSSQNLSQVLQWILFLCPSPRLFILHIGMSGQMWYLEAQEFGPWSSKLQFQLDKFGAGE